MSTCAVHNRHLEGEVSSTTIVRRGRLWEVIILSAADRRVGRHTGNDRRRGIHDRVRRGRRVDIATGILGIPSAYQRSGVAATGHRHLVQVGDGHTVAVVNRHRLVGRQGITAFKRIIGRYVREDGCLLVHNVDHVRYGIGVSEVIGDDVGTDDVVGFTTGSIQNLVAVSEREVLVAVVRRSGHHYADVCCAAHIHVLRKLSELGSLGIEETDVITTVTELRVVAAAVVDDGTGGEVAGLGIGTTALAATEGERHPLLVDVVALREDLHVELSAELTIRGQLGEEHLVVIAGNSIGHIGIHEPTGTNDVVDGETGAALEDGAPRLGLGQTLDVAFTVGPHRSGVDADGEPAVEFDLGNEIVQDRVDAVREDTTVGVLIEVSRSLHKGGVLGLAGHGAHLVGGIRRRDVDAVRGVTGDAIGGVLLDFHTILREVGGVSGTAAEVTGTVVLIGHRRIVARNGVHTTAEVAIERITNAVSIAVHEALTIAIILGHRISAASIILGGIGVVVARSAIGTTEATREFTGAVIDCRRGVVVAGRSIGATRATQVLTGAIIEGGVRIEVTGVDVDAAEGLLFVTDAIGIAVVDAIAVAVEERTRCVRTGTITVQRGRIVVARRRVGTAEAGHIVTGSIILGRGVVIVAGTRIRTAVATGRVTGTIVEGRNAIIVTGQGVCAPGDLHLITESILIDVRETLSHAIHVVHSEDVNRVEAGNGNGGRGIIVAGQLFRAARARGILAVVLRISEVASERQFTSNGLHRGRRPSVDTAVDQEVGHTCLIVVGGGITTAAVEITGTVHLDGGRGIIVASERNHTARAGLKLTGAVVEVGTDVEVASQGVGTTLILTGAVSEIGSLVIVAGRGVEAATEEAGTIVDCSRGIVVHGTIVHTTAAAEEFA